MNTAIRAIDDLAVLARAARIIRRALDRDRKRRDPGDES
jgi:hypothetical protein